MYYQVIKGFDNYYQLDKYLEENKTDELKNLDWLFVIKEDNNQELAKLQQYFDPDYIISILKPIHDGQLIIVHTNVDCCKELKLINGSKTRQFISYIINHHYNYFSVSYSIYHWIETYKTNNQPDKVVHYYDFRRNSSMILTFDKQSIYDWQPNEPKDIRKVLADVPELGFMKAVPINSLCHRCIFSLKNTINGTIHKSLMHCAVNPSNDPDCTLQCKDFES
jgi:hypothetical protein